MAGFFDSEKFTTFKDNLKVETPDKSKVEDYVKQLEVMYQNVEKVNSAMSTLNSNGRFDQVGSGIQNLGNALNTLTSKTTDLNSIEQAFGNVVNTAERLKQVANVSMNIASPEEVKLLQDLVGTINDVSKGIGGLPPLIDVAKRNLHEIADEVNKLATSNFGQEFGRNIDQMGAGIKNLKGNLEDIIKQSGSLNLSSNVTSEAKKLQDIVLSLSNSMSQMKDLQNSMTHAQLEPDKFANTIPMIAKDIEAETQKIKDNIKAAFDIKNNIDVDSSSQAAKDFIDKIASNLNTMDNLFPSKLLEQLGDFREKFAEAQKDIANGTWTPNTEEATTGIRNLIEMVLNFSAASRKTADDITNISDAFKHNHETLTVDFALMRQNTLVFDSINDSIKSVTESLEKSSESAKSLVNSLNDQGKAPASLSSMHNELKEMIGLMAELKATNDQEGLMFANPEENALKRDKVAKLHQSAIGNFQSVIKNHGQEFDTQGRQTLINLFEQFSIIGRELSKVDKTVLNNLSAEGKKSDYAQILQNRIEDNTLSESHTQHLLRNDDALNVANTKRKIDRLINNQDTSSPEAELVRLASANRAGSQYEMTMRKATTGSYDLSQQANKVKEELNSDNSKYTWSQKSALNNAVNIESVSKSAEELARLMAIFDKNKDAYLKAIQEYSKTGKGEKDINKRGNDLGLLQARIVGQASDLAEGLNLDRIDNKTLKEMGKDGEALISTIKDLIITIRKSTEHYGEFGKKIADKGIVDEVSKLGKELENVEEKLVSNTQKTENWTSSLMNLFDKGLSRLGSLARGFGLGALAGGIGGILSGIPSEWSQMRRATANTAMVDYGMGAEFNEAAARDRIVTQGDRFYRMSNGMIDFEEMNNRYNSMARNVGGGYGKTQNEGAADLNQITQETFALSKVYNVSDSTMNDSVKTFYKDLHMSATEATYTIHTLAQTAIASNIPVEKYLKLVSGLAQQYKSLGFDGKEAMSVMQNMVYQGATAEQAQKFTSQVGNAMGNFADNDNETAFFGVMSGQFDDPFEAVAKARHRVDKNFKPVDGWSDMIAKSMDTKLEMYGALGEGNENLQSMILNKEFRKMGMSADMSSAATDMYMTDRSGFSSWLKDNQSKMGSPEDKIAASNDKLEEQIKNASKQLSQTDKTLAELKADVRTLANKLGPLIDQAIKPLTDMIRNLMGTIATELDKFTKSKTWQALQNGIGGLTKGLLIATAAMFGLKVLGTVFTNGSKVIKTAMDKTVTAIDRLIAALNKKSVSSDTDGLGSRDKKGGSWWSKTGKGALSKGLKFGGATAILGSALENSGEYAEDLLSGKEGAHGRFFANTAIDSAWAVPGAVIGGAIGSVIPGLGTTFGAMAGGYATQTLGQYVNKWTADEDGRGINDRMKSYLSNMGSGSSLPVSEMSNNTDTSMIPTSATAGSTNLSSLYGMSTAEASPSTMSEEEKLANMSQVDNSTKTVDTQDAELMTIVQGLTQNMIKPEEYGAMLDKSDANHAQAIDTINTRLAKEAKVNKEHLHQDQLTKMANMSEAEKIRMFEIQRAVNDGSKDNVNKLGEVVQAILSLKGGFGGSGNFPKGLGMLARKYESSGDPGSVANVNDHWSYGLYQIDTTTGNMPKFLDFLKQKNPQMAKQLSAPIDSEEFRNSWKNLGATQGDAFGNIQHQWIMKEYYQPLVDYMKEKHHMDVNTRSRGLQEALVSLGVQHGVGGAGTILDEVMASNPSSEKELIHKIYATRMRKNPQTKDRYEREMTEAEALADQKAIASYGDYGGVGNYGDSIVSVANKYLGMNYKLGGNGIDSTDCSKLTQDVYAANGIDLGTRRADYQMDEFTKRGGTHRDESKLKPGDLVFMRGSDPGENGVGHVGIYAGNGQYIHAPSTGDVVKYSNLSDRNDIVAYGDQNVFSTNGQPIMPTDNANPVTINPITVANNAQKAQEDKWKSMGIDPTEAKKQSNNPFVTGGLLFHVLGSSYTSNGSGKGINYDEITHNLDSMGASKVMNAGINNQRAAKQFAEKYLGVKDTAPIKTDGNLNSNLVKVENAPAIPHSNIYQSSVDKINEAYTLTDNEGKGKKISIDFRMRTDGKSKKFVDDFERVVLDFVEKYDAKIETIQKEVTDLHVNNANDNINRYNDNKA